MRERREEEKKEDGRRGRRGKRRERKNKEGREGGREMRERREEEESTLKGEEDRDRETFEQRSYSIELNHPSPTSKEVRDGLAIRSQGYIKHLYLHFR